VHWRNDWESGRKERMKVKNKRLIKIDLYSMAKGHILTKRKFAKLTKKQKAQHNVFHFSVGFGIGFTKSILTNLFKLRGLTSKTRKQENLILSKGDLQKRKIFKKKKKN